MSFYPVCVQAVCAYRLGEYRFRAPPVCHVQWQEKDWIAFIFGVYWR